MRLNRLLKTLVILVVLCLSPAAGQKSWEKKPFREWTLTEVLRILNDSPWAQTAYETDPTTPSLPAVSYSVTVQLRSAMTIRQAMVRQRQLTLGYDKFSIADRQRFDLETKEFLECGDCAKYYLVTLTSYHTQNTERPNIPGGYGGIYSVDIGAHLRKLTLKDLQPHVHLSNDKSERRALSGYIPPAANSQTAMFIFSRLDEQGKPLITPGHKKLHFEINRKVFNKLGVALKKFTFDVDRLVQGDQIVF